MIVFVNEKSADRLSGSDWPLTDRIAELLRTRFAAAGVIGLIAPTGRPLVEAWQACVEAGRKPIILHFPTAKLSRVYWQEEIANAISTIGIDLLIAADLQCLPDTWLPSILLTDLTPSSAAAADGGALRPLPASGCVIQMSSGTTGRRKGIDFSLSDIYAHVDQYNKILQAGPGDTIVSWLPLYHDMGFIATFLLPRIVGCDLVLIDPIDWVRRPEILWECIEQYRGTICYMPNFGFELMAARARPQVGMRRWISCSEPTRASTMAKFIAATCSDPATVANCWGMAENVFAVAQSEGIRSRELDGVGAVSCGRPVPGTEVKVVDDELYVRSEYSLRSYIGTGAELDGQGFYPTGDFGRIVDGEVYLVGRKRDLINVAGRKALLSELDFTVGQEVPQSAGRIAVFGLPSPALGTETPVVLIEDAEFWVQNRDSELLRRIVERTGFESTQAAFVPPRFITKTSSGKINRRKTAEFWEMARAGGARPQRAEPDPVRAAGEVNRLFPWIAFDKPIGEQIDSLAFVNLGLALATYGFGDDLRPEDDLQTVLRHIPATGAVQTLKVVSLTDANPFRVLMLKTLGEMMTRYPLPLQFKHVCAPPPSILLSDLVFADYFMCRDPRPEVYQPLVSVLDDIRGASCLIVDDASLLMWPYTGMVYPQISHDFRRHPKADFLGVRWAGYATNHHQIGVGLVNGNSLKPEEVNLHLKRLGEYLGIPIIRIAYGANNSHLTYDWEVQGDGDVYGIPKWDLTAIDREKMEREFTEAIDKVVGEGPPRLGENKRFINLNDAAHWCGWLINKQLLDFIVDNYDDVVALGRPSSVPYLLHEMTRRGKRIRYRSDLEVPPDCDCVVQNGSWGPRPKTDKPVFQIMGAGWLGEIPEELADVGLPLGRVTTDEDFADW
ncbi:MAG TPA: AMP-binding protein [Stellaceae bacterium]|nr:AMP-binding protein [Stellaceae bacterium]